MIRADRWLIGVTALVSFANFDERAGAQTVLPQIVVTAPSPISRNAPAAGPAWADTLRGELPIVADQFATVTVVTREELERRNGNTLGDVLQSRPGMTASSFAPGAASRPIVRGLDNYRVRIQENGLSASGVSEIGEDHGVPVDPLAAQQIEVVRGPGTLRWGSQAIGGVVNVDNNRIPTALPSRGFSAELKGAASSADNGVEGAVLLDAGKDNVAFHADAYGRRADDYRIPGYPYLRPADQTLPFSGRQPNSSQRSEGQSVGGSYLFDGGFVGIAVSRFGALYRVPGVEATETNTRIDMTQTKVTSKGEFRPDSPFIATTRFWFGATDYKHDELANEGGFDGVQQTFTNREQEGRVEVKLNPVDLKFATLTTALGVQASHQKLDAPGVEGGLFDPNSTKTLAGYVFNEFQFDAATRMQLSGRIERANINGAVPDLFVDPNVAIDRSLAFTPKSGAVGLLRDLPWGLVASVTGQYVERAPRAPELLSRGVHEATGTFDIGDPGLRIEKAQTVEVGLRRPKGQFRFEATVYYTRFQDFIYRNLTGETCDADFASCTVNGVGAGGELNQAIYAQRDATFRGGEFQAQLDVAPFWGGMWGVDGQYDIVRATFADGSNVPRIPPHRLGGGVFWRDGNWFSRLGLLHAFAQNDVSENETATSGYNLLKAELSYTKALKNDPFGMTAWTVGVVGDNLLNEDVRNAASFKKDEVMLPGIGVRLFANVRF
jgi:iron complex outermembrane receptor protein